MDFTPFDVRHYPTLGVADGYSAWAPTYEATVLDVMDLRLLARCDAVSWRGIARAADLACGTGRIGAWLRARGVKRIDGVDITAAMLAGAREKDVYDGLSLASVAQTGLESGVYDLVTQSLACEHLKELGPLYAEVARLLSPRGVFVIVGYHPFFLLSGIPTHFDRAPGEPIAIESYVHLASDHVRAARAVGLRLETMDEGLVDDDMIRLKAKWEKYRDRPMSFLMAWRRV
jgi:SAM-dependent methyltransferase